MVPRGPARTCRRSKLPPPDHDRCTDPIDLTATDWERCVELIDTYLDLGLGVVDASIVAVAERLGLATIATMNTRDFRVVRPAHIDTFELVPVSAPD